MLLMLRTINHFVEEFGYMTWIVFWHIQRQLLYKTNYMSWKRQDFIPVSEIVRCTCTCTCKSVTGRCS